ncbi:MAG: TRAP transporter small permease [Desulfobacterales bacterium]|jgi:C4-dicarboxylate transporter DctQ subunit
MEKLSDFIDKVTLTTASVLLVIIAVIVNWGVFCRYVLFAPLPWSEQIPKYAMIWMGFLGASVGISRSRHIGFDILVTRLPSMMRKTITFAGHIIVLFFLVMMTIYGVSFAFAVGFSSKAPMLPIPMFYLFLAVPVGGVFMILQAVIRIFLDLKKFNH